MTPFALDYVIWVFVSATAILQAVAAWSGLAGLLFFRRWPRRTLNASLLSLVAAYVWFFASERRNQPDVGMGLDGPSQAQWFAAGAAAALVLTLALSSILNHSWAVQSEKTGLRLPFGADALRHTTFARALAARTKAFAARSRR